MKTKRLYRSNTEKIIAGVCGGVGEYFNIDPVIVRIAWIFFTLVGGAGFLAYIIAWFIIPQGQNEEDATHTDQEKRTKGCLLIVLAVIGFGVLIPIFILIIRILMIPFNIVGSLMWPFAAILPNAFWIRDGFFVIGVLVTIAAIIAMIVLILKSGNKNKE